MTPPATNICCLSPLQGILKGEASLYHWAPVWLGISCMTTDNFCFNLQNRPIQTSQTGGQWYSDPSPFSIPCSPPRPQRQRREGLWLWHQIPALSQSLIFTIGDDLEETVLIPALCPVPVRRSSHLTLGPDSSSCVAFCFLKDEKDGAKIKIAEVQKNFHFNFWKYRGFFVS